MKEKIKLCQKVNKFLSHTHDNYSESYYLIKDIRTIIKYLPIIDLFQEESSI